MPDDDRRNKSLRPEVVDERLSLFAALLESIDRKDLVASREHLRALRRRGFNVVLTAPAGGREGGA